MNTRLAVVLPGSYDRNGEHPAGNIQKPYPLVETQLPLQPFFFAAGNDLLQGFRSQVVKAVLSGADQAQIWPS